MINYIKKSILKFKEDVVSKMIYDILKWLLILCALFAFSNLLPDKTNFKTVISTIIYITVYQIILLIIGVAVITILCVYLVFNLKYKVLKSNYLTDKLTGLKNHIALEQYLQNKIQTSKKDGISLSLILIDIDNFKQVNEKVGYNVADELLKKVGEVLGNDKRATDETFRYFQRGDEFLIVLSETSLDGAIKAANRKRILISKINFEINKITEQLTVCCGVTEFNKVKDTNVSCLERLNKALQEAKKTQNKNCVKSII